ncbi:MAG: helix-turn-helix domain-containing protein [Bacteroidetes bacterium]|nr:helix-turn-helix domain-containing protein [Bacteroidota bacterium]
MKVVDFRVPKIKKEAFRIQEDVGKFFYDQLHQHPEIQLMLILEGEGTLIAGDYVGRFGSGDLFVLGSGLPHVFRSDKKYYELGSKLRTKAVSIYFNEHYWGDSFWQLEELKLLRKFVARSAQALQITGKKKDSVAAMMCELKNKQGIDKLILFFSMLKELIQIKGATPLAVAPRANKIDSSEGKRMNAILSFTFRESHRKIYIKEAADVAHLSVEAFCRYFKVHTRKTYTAFLNEVRVSNACQLLIGKDYSISEVSAMSGFANLSNFNRIFKRVTGKSPSRYA